jgi:dTDP-4-dehydrorhamnose reductase
MKILITGFSGMLGADIAEIFTYNLSNQVFGICRNYSETKLKNINEINIDVTNINAFSKVLKEIKPNLIIHCAALVDVDKCELEKEYADNLHARFLDSILIHSPNSKLIYISTDSVFDGETGNYLENSIPNPLNYYASSKFLGENRIIEFHKNFLIIRTNIFGFHYPSKPSLVEWALSKLLNNESIGGFNDVYFNPIYTKHLAEIIYKLNESKTSGILNIGTDLQISKYQFLIKLAKGFSINTNLIEEKSVKNVRFTAKRPLNTTLSTAKLENIIGYIPSIDNGINQLIADYKLIYNI